MKKILLCACVLWSAYGFSQSRPSNPLMQSSTNGFFILPHTDCRQIYSFNNDWLYHKGDIAGAHQATFADNSWEQVQLPHGLDILPEFVSGGGNYQGIVWYRKHFRVPENLSRKRLSLSFEAIMGKCEIYLNGKLIKKHKGGYLPIVLDVSTSNVLNVRGNNTIAIKADNSDDPSYPPGKPEREMDFTYSGGIYRNAWLLATNDIHITDANFVDKVAGGGVRVAFSGVSKQQAVVEVSVDLTNESSKNASIVLSLGLKDQTGKSVAGTKKELTLNKGANKEVQQSFVVKDPLLWSPDDPNLYDLQVEIKNNQQIIDGYSIRTGIKLVELKGKAGLYLNGAPFEGKLMGVNHHQDFGYIGNAVPDNLQWRDAKIMRDAGIKIIRLSHYPQSPAFMDACDALGIFTIVCSPGWQFWNDKNPEFEKLMERDIRHMIRRDRNHASVFAWEPPPNETHYPKEFGKKMYEITHAEDPSKNCIAANNYGYPHWQMYDLIYGDLSEKIESKTDKSIFTREWGDNVVDWSSQNSINRINKAWGELPQLEQTRHLSNPPYFFESWETFYESPKQDLGGSLWHFFDTPRGYHPNAFYGGIVDAFRRPKYAYYLFQSQQNANDPHLARTKSTPYYLHIANMLSVFSSSDAMVFTNCDSVKLLKFGLDSATLAPDKKLKMPHPPLIFTKTFHFDKIKTVLWPPPEVGEKPKEKMTNVKLTAIGYAKGKEVIRVTRQGADRPSKIVLQADLQGMKPVADGSFIIPVFAMLVDKNGTLMHLNNELIRFSVEGEAVLIGKNVAGVNPHPLVWGEAPALIRTTLKPGNIKITAALEYPTRQIPNNNDTLILQSDAASIPTIL